MRVCVVMPAYNEESGIAEFVGELSASLSAWETQFVVVNDCSNDSTAAVASSLSSVGIKIKVVTNEVNSGHGPSTVRALNLGLESGADLIVAIDGDGQFLGSDVAKLIGHLEGPDCDIVEGVRTQRGDPAYRRLVSLSTRLLVALKARRVPSDANTPLRVYRRASLERILGNLRPDITIPNLVISTNTRRLGFCFEEITVRSIPRRGGDPSSISWGKSRRQVPTRRFLRFCSRAVKDFWTA